MEITEVQVRFRRFTAIFYPGVEQVCLIFPMRQALLLSFDQLERELKRRQKEREKGETK